MHLLNSCARPVTHVPSSKSRMHMRGSFSPLKRTLQSESASLRTTLTLLFAVILGTSAFGDIVEMKDGRRIEGLILSQTPSEVVIDTVARNMRATISLPADQVSSVKGQPLPENFFNPPSPPPRISDPKTIKPKDALYLEVPIVGQFGQDIFAEGIRAALAYAAKHRISHVVFTIDSRGAGDLDEAIETFHVLKNYTDQLTYHAIIRNCTGNALSVAIHCDSIFVAPGAQVGAASEKPTDANLTPQDARTLRAQLARDAAAAVRNRGGDDRFIQAMINPAYKLAAWKNDAGKVEIGQEPSASIPPDRIIFKAGGDQLLVLSSDQLAKLGMPLFQGGPQDLGSALKIQTWRLESNYGTTAMQDAVKKTQATLANNQAQFEGRVADNIARRQSADRALRYLMRQAQTNDPSNATYESYTVRWGRGWQQGSTEVMRDDSRQQWQWRTDKTLDNLDQALQAAKTLLHLDAEAVQLGLQPTYQPGELEGIVKDIQAHIDTLEANRDKTEL